MLAAILFFPLIGFLINSILIASAPHKQKASVSGAIASSVLFASFVCAVACFVHLNQLEDHQRVIEETLFQWINVGGFHLPFVLRLDPLSSVMTLIITGVGFLIHVYSTGYMAHDATPGKFFCYLNLFCFAMLALVLGGNLPILFLGWEGVGLCSYLLIGYWYEDPAKAAAGMKAFVVNRIGDLGFLAGIFFLFGLFHTVDFAQLKLAASNHANVVDGSLLTIATLCLFVGAMGKSAQIPLYVWLPDAMAGPTPVSALIHAATMVTAGVYMICRMNYLFSLCPLTMQVISGVGALTAFFAATIAITQRDIKKVLAYSTVSQLGYMFMAVGVGAYVAGVFHLMTHAFFKALLFLGSGSVIHGMHEEQDIIKMGGLQKYMPQTFATFAVGTIAIAGIPPLAGFWSKDEILWNAFSSHHGLAGPALWLVGAATALMTAFYMTRLTCLTFLGEPRFNPKTIGSHAGKHHDDHGHSHGHGHGHDHHDDHAPKAGVHESPALMVVPLVVLAFLSVVGGFLGLPHYSWLEHWLEPVVGGHGVEEAASQSLEWILMGLSTCIAVLGVSSAYYLYVKNPKLPEKLKASLHSVYSVLFHKYYIDEIYDFLFVRPLQKVAHFFWKVVDVILVDGSVLGLAKLSQLSGEVARLIQTGAIQIYAAFMLMGIALLVGYFIYGLR